MVVVGKRIKTSFRDGCFTLKINWVKEGGIENDVYGTVGFFGRMILIIYISFFT